MEQVIYADILFLIDISMDFLAIYITAWLLKVRFGAGRALLSAVIGAAFSVISVINRNDSLFLSVAVSVLMCFIAFSGNGFVTKLKGLAVFYAVSFLLGGAMTALFNAFNTLSDGTLSLIIHGEVNTVQSNMPLALFYAGFGAIVLLFSLFKRLLSSRPKNAPLEAVLTLGGRTEKLVLIEDSGNLLCEPISGEPIVFLKERALKKFANEALLSSLKMENEFYNGKEKQKYRVVIYKTVSGSDMCVCTRAQRLTVNKKLCSAWIAIGKNFKNDVYDGIIPSSLLN